MTPSSTPRACAFWQRRLPAPARRRRIALLCAAALAAPLGPRMAAAQTTSPLAVAGSAAFGSASPPAVAAEGRAPAGSGAAPSGTPAAVAALRPEPMAQADRRRMSADRERPTPLADEVQLTIALGEIRMLPIEGKTRRIALGNGANVSATTVDQNLMLIGETPGVTSMMVWTDRHYYAYRIRVVPSDFTALRRLIDRIMQRETNFSIEEFDNRVVVSGSAHLEAIARLQELQKANPNLMVNLRSDGTEPQTRSVLFRLYFVEINKSLLENIGVRWSDSIQGPSAAVQSVPLNTGIYRNIRAPQNNENLLADPPPFVSANGHKTGAFFGLASAISSRINLAVSNGDARILAAPELTAKSGGKARLQVGGQVPIPMAGAFGAQTVEFKDYGIIFSIEPVIDGGDVISAAIKTELSQIDPAVSVGGIPGFLNRSTDTEVSVRPGEMIALSGLVNAELSNAVDKVPGLGNVPILGRLFRSDDFRNRKTDLVVLLEPEIVVAGEGIAEEVKRRGLLGRQEFEDRTGAARVREAPPTPGDGTPPRPVDPKAPPVVSPVTSPVGRPVDDGPDGPK